MGDPSKGSLPASSLRGWGVGKGKGRESLQQCLKDLNSAPNAPRGFQLPELIKFGLSGQTCFEGFVALITIETLTETRNHVRQTSGTQVVLFLCIRIKTSHP